MTAINIITGRRKAFMMTDGAGYGANGSLLSAVNKVATIPHLRMALATRGGTIATGIVAALMGSRYQRFDDLVAHGAGTLAKDFEDVLEPVLIVLDSPEPHFQVFVSGWSEARDRPASYILTTFYSPEQGLEPWIFHEIDPITAAPVPSMEAMAAAGMEEFDPDHFDPKRHGLPLMEAQRRTPMNFLAGSTDGEGCGVGVFACLTEITAESVTQRIVHRWPDEIGRPIDPDAAAPAVPDATLTRQQRRAAERAARKKERV